MTPKEIEAIRARAFVNCTCAPRDATEHHPDCRRRGSVALRDLHALCDALEAAQAKVAKLEAALAAAKKRARR